VRIRGGEPIIERTEDEAAMATAVYPKCIEDIASGLQLYGPYAYSLEK
jgi:hypothetical protein